jgi:hypothetical protein
MGEVREQAQRVALGLVAGLIAYATASIAMTGITWATNDATLSFLAQLHIIVISRH